MIRLKLKLALFNLLSKLVFTGLFLAFLPYLIERINLRQADNELVEKREQVLSIISGIGIEPFINSGTTSSFGSFNILKDEFISLEKVDFDENLNQIEVTERLIEDEVIEYRVIKYTFLIDKQNYLLEIGKSLTSILRTRQNIMQVIIIFLISIILLTFITDLQYHRYLLRPLDLITSRLKSISNPALFERTAVRTSTTDFHQLDNSLRELMERINDLFQKEKDITVNISHELLTPISVIRSKLENLLLSSDLDNEASNKVEESLKTLHRLQSLVNSLLFISRMESRQYVLEEDFSINDVIEEIITEIGPVAEDSNIRISTEMKEDFHFVNGNRSLIFSMFFNVINNAVINTNEGGVIKIRCFRESEAVFKTVISDNGKGMTENQMKTIFSRFRTRTGPSESGAGIGLAIAKTIADLHSTAIDVRSEEGKGTAFTFIFH